MKMHNVALAAFLIFFGAGAIHAEDTFEGLNVNVKRLGEIAKSKAECLPPEKGLARKRFGPWIVFQAGEAGAFVCVNGNQYLRVMGVIKAIKEDAQTVRIESDVDPIVDPPIAIFHNADLSPKNLRSHNVSHSHVVIANAMDLAWACMYLNGNLMIFIRREEPKPLRSIFAALKRLAGKTPLMTEKKYRDRLYRYLANRVVAIAPYLKTHKKFIVSMAPRLNKFTKIAVVVETFPEKNPYPNPNALYYSPKRRILGTYKEFKKEINSQGPVLNWDL